MEESHNMNSKEDMLPPEKTKRQLKTPAQIEALEKFYNEHKYPSESMKLQFAKQIGLSEKQVSGWFCHRRLKDKKLFLSEDYANGKQSLSNGAIHDHISGLRQESISSTKQGDKYFDYKEVESKRFYSSNPSASVRASELKEHHIQVANYNVGDDRSSGSCSASQDRLLQQNKYPYAMKPSSYSLQEENYTLMNDEPYMLMNSKGVKSKGHMMDSRYSSLQADIENPAISSVKRKLGGRHGEDGPPLGVVFDPLPPGAFDSPVKDSNYEPYYMGDPSQRRSCSIPKIIKEPKVYDKYRCNMLSSGSYPGVGFGGTRKQYYHQNEFTSSRLTPKTSFTEHSDHISNQTFIMENRKDSSGKSFAYSSRKNGKCFKNRVQEGFDSGVGHHHANGLKVNTSKSFSYPRLQYNCSSPVFQREEYGAKFSKSALQSNGFLNTEDTVQPIRPIKKGKVHEEMRILKNQNSIQQEMLMTSETKMSRRANDIKLQLQEYLMKYSDKFESTKPVIRYSGDLATSLSDDETGDTTSSVD